MTYPAFNCRLKDDFSIRYHIKDDFSEQVRRSNEANYDKGRGPREPEEGSEIVEELKAQHQIEGYELHQRKQTARPGYFP